MTDLNALTKDALNARLAAPLRASQLKKKSKADLIAMFDAMPATDALDADLRDAGADDPEPPTADNLTDLEKRVLVAHLDAGIDCNGAETLDAMLSDNMTWSDVAETSNRTGLTKKQVSGVIASLSTKGLLDADVEKPKGQAGVDQVLTDKGLRIAFDLLGDGVVANPGPTPAPKAKSKPSNVVAMPTPKKVRTLEDRVLVEPTTDLSNVRPIREGTKRHAMVQALLKGCTLDQLAEATGWKRDVAGAAIYTDLKAAGLGMRSENGLLILMLPNGSNVVPLRPAAATADKAANR